MLSLFAFTAASLNAWLFSIESAPGLFIAVYEREDGRFTHYAVTPERVPSDLSPARPDALRGFAICEYLRAIVYGQDFKLLEPFANYDEIRARYAGEKLERMYMLTGELQAYAKDAPPALRDLLNEAMIAAERDIDAIRDTESRNVLNYLSRLNKGAANEPGATPARGAKL